MAESEYRRLTCAVTACDGVHKAQGYCLRHYRQWQRGGVKEDPKACAHCGASLVGAQVNAMYCRRWCALQAWRQANPEAATLHRLRSAKAKVAPEAAPRCAVYFNRCRVCTKQWTGQTRRNYCGEACAKADGARKTRLASESKHKAAGKVVHCDECSLAFCPVYGAQGAHDLCTPCAEVRRRRWRQLDGGSHVQRAKRYGVPYRYFNVTTVLKRDNWTCQLCGIPTPEHARGSYRPDAPEFDHCIPLALGGQHLPENGQCLCRSCNGSKADKWCERSAAAAVARGLVLPTGWRRKGQEATHSADLTGVERIGDACPATR